jgi:hypothetical protein
MDRLLDILEKNPDQEICFAGQALMLKYRLTDWPRLSSNKA